MSNDERDRQLYKYPGTDVLRNKLDIRDQTALNQTERQFVGERIEQGAPKGDFDLAHLQAIHKHLFQDVYEWAGEIRKVDFHKTSWFLPHSRIEMGMADVHSRLKRDQYLSGRTRENFTKGAAEIIGDVNYVHPFREGNGRTQLLYLEQLSERAGHRIDLSRFDRDQWIQASIAANEKQYEPMRACIDKAIETPNRQKERPDIEKSRDHLDRYREQLNEQYRIDRHANRKPDRDRGGR